MSPEYIEELADLADPEQLWRLAVDRFNLPDEKIKQLDAGVALRRYASHARQLNTLLREGKSMLITPLSACGVAIKSVETPQDHQKLRRRETPNNG